MANYYMMKTTIQNGEMWEEQVPIKAKSETQALEEYKKYATTHGFSTWTLSASGNTGFYSNPTNEKETLRLRGL